MYVSGSVSMTPCGPSKLTFAIWRTFLPNYDLLGFEWGRGAKSVIWQMEFTQCWAPYYSLFKISEILRSLQIFRQRFSLISECLGTVDISPELMFLYKE